MGCARNPIPMGGELLTWEIILRSRRISIFSIARRRRYPSWPLLPLCFAPGRHCIDRRCVSCALFFFRACLDRMKIQCGIEVAMDLGVCQLRHFSISFLSSLLGTESGAVRLDSSSASGASVVAIDNKIEQAMDLVKSHLMYAVREEVEVLKEQIKELIEKNSQLEQENSLLKTLASPEQMAQFQAQLQTGSSPASTQPPAPPASGPPGTA